MWREGRDPVPSERCDSSLYEIVLSQIGYALFGDHDIWLESNNLMEESVRVCVWVCWRLDKCVRESEWRYEWAVVVSASVEKCSCVSKWACGRARAAVNESARKKMRNTLEYIGLCRVKGMRVREGLGRMRVDGGEEGWIRSNNSLRKCFSWETFDGLTSYW